MPTVGVGQRGPRACGGGAAVGTASGGGVERGRDGEWAATTVGTAVERATAIVGEHAAAAAEVRDAAGPKEQARSGGGMRERVRE